MPNDNHPHILVVDDEHFIRDALQLYFESNSFLVSTAASGDEAVAEFARAKTPIDVVILDLIMPGTHGLELLKILKDSHPTVEFIIATGCGSMGNAVEALRLGACDYVTKPIVDFDEDLLKAVEKALSIRNRRAGARAAPSRSASEAEKSERREPLLPLSRQPQRLEVYDRLTQLVAEHGNAPVSQECFAAIWSALADSFDTDAALLVRRRVTEDWEFIASWGFPEPQTPRDLWHTLASGTVSILSSGFGTVRRCVLRPQDGNDSRSREEQAWEEIYQVPLDAREDGDLLLWLFFKGKADLRVEVGPLPLLVAALSYVLREDKAVGPLTFSPRMLQIEQRKSLPPATCWAGSDALERLDAPRRPA